MKIAILGAGTWGTALSVLLKNNGHEIRLWSAIESEIRALQQGNRHPNLPDTPLPEGIIYTTSIGDCIDSAELVIFVVPSRFMRSTAEAASPFLRRGMLLATASKGIEPVTHMTMTEIIEDVMAKSQPKEAFEYLALSGPTHAEEVAVGMPTAIVCACKNESSALKVAEIFSSTCMRAYTNTDVRGVEICGAMKNIIALAAGITRGMGFGDNACAMLLTRGISEMTRLGLALGCHRRTFMGLSGFGDLVVTATSRHSRNNRCGELIGRGMSYDQAAKEIGMVVEGYYALDAAIGLSQKLGVELPITEAVYGIIHLGTSAKEAMLTLMNRSIKSEL